MPPENILQGQRVSPKKIERSRKFRKEPTPAEERLWQAIRKKQAGGLRFRRQQVIDGFIVDFYCHEAALVVEVDGAIHEQQQEYDEQRSLVLEQHGLVVLRFTNQDVFENLSGCLAKILEVGNKTPPKPSPHGVGTDWWTCDPDSTFRKFTTM